MMIETYEAAALSHERNTQEPLKEPDREQSQVTWPETTLNPAGPSMLSFGKVIPRRLLSREWDLSSTR